MRTQKTTQTTEEVHDNLDPYVIVVTALNGEKVIRPEVPLDKTAELLAGSPFMLGWLTEQVKAAFLSGQKFESRTRSYSLKEQMK